MALLACPPSLQEAKCCHAHPPREECDWRAVACPPLEATQHIQTNLHHLSLCSNSTCCCREWLRSLVAASPSRSSSAPVWSVESCEESKKLVSVFDSTHVAPLPIIFVTSIHSPPHVPNPPAAALLRSVSQDPPGVGPGLLQGDKHMWGRVLCGVWCTRARRSPHGVCAQQNFHR